MLKTISFMKKKSKSKSKQRNAKELKKIDKENNKSSVLCVDVNIYEAKFS